MIKLSPSMKECSLKTENENENMEIKCDNYNTILAKQNTGVSCYYLLCLKTVNMAPCL